MQINISLLAKRAISLALQGNWESAIHLNNQILGKDPKNIDAKLRLGKAYIQTKQYIKAKKTFKEIIALDPINQVAQKNLALINSKKVEPSVKVTVDAGSLIKEPGTTYEIALHLEGRGLTADHFSAGEQLTLKVKKKSVEVLRIKNAKEILVGSIVDPDTVKRLNLGVNKNAALNASFIKGEDRTAQLLLKSSTPIFKSEKQDIRPYFKKGSLDEPEIEMEELEALTLS